MHPGAKKQSIVEFEWGDLFSDETPMHIIKRIVAMEEDLI